MPVQLPTHLEIEKARLDARQAAEQAAITQSRAQGLQAANGQARQAFERVYPAGARARNRISTYANLAIGLGLTALGPVGAAVGLPCLGWSARASARHSRRMVEAAPEIREVKLTAGASEVGIRQAQDAAVEAAVQQRVATQTITQAPAPVPRAEPAGLEAPSLGRSLR